MSGRCPTCGKPSGPAVRPFCSQGCKDRDLLRWMDEGYRIAGHALDPDLAYDAIGGGVDKPDAPD